MASQLLNEPKIESSERFLLRDILPGAGWAPFGTRIGDLPSDLDLSSEELVEEENCPRGILVATCLEVVAGLGIYGCWHALHFIR